MISPVAPPAPTTIDSVAARSRDGGVCLIVGDWFVDEHWVCGVHRSSSSSRTGKTHLRALHSGASTVRSFCGAGRSAFFLHQLYNARDRGSTAPQAPTPPRPIIGLGFWHQADTDALASLFDPYAPADTPYRLTMPTLSHPEGIELINMNDALNLGATGDFRARTEYTTRIIRIYRHVERGEVVYDRLDWEPKASGRSGHDEATVNWTTPKLTELRARLEAQLDGRVVRAVMLKDLRKGAVNDSLVSWLASVVPQGTRWYVSSKQWSPNWLSSLGANPGVDLRLLMIPQVAAREATRARPASETTPAIEMTRWLARSGRPSPEAIALLKDVQARSGAARILVTPEAFSSLACECEGRAITRCIVQSRPKPETATVDMGGASILFAALVACMEDPQARELELEKLLSLSLRVTHEWVESEAKRVSEPKDWKPAPREWKGNQTFRAMQDLINEADKGQSELRVDGVKDFGSIKSFSWDEEIRQWDQALKAVGIVERREKAAAGGVVGWLELWRSMLEVDEYVCCDAATRQQLRRLLRGIQSFARSPRHHASCMLVASPGSGKTFLAKRLAETARLRVVPFNITQMRSKGDILECLDTVVAAQAESPEKRLLVFIDEINAELEAGHVYGAFLTPLEDGSYVRSGRSFNIRPCVWVFAGTEPPRRYDPKSSVRRAAAGGSPKTEKESDFVSRLTLGVVDLRKGVASAVAADESVDEVVEHEHATELRALENVYLGVALLKQEFPDARLVSERVLRAFLGLPLRVVVRDIKHFVRRFDDIQYGEVTSRSVPDEWPGEEQGVKAFMKWKARASSYSDRANIEIVTAAESALTTQYGILHS